MIGDDDGSGYGYGSGSGDGYGYGSGSGDGSGDGYGYGDGDGILATVAGHSARLLAPFSWLRIGCQVHPIAHWRQHWRDIAANQGVEVSEEEACALLAKAINATEAGP